jgi:hypothetical protein
MSRSLGGCDFAADPSLPATATPVFWVSASTSVLTTAPLPAPFSGRTTPHLNWPSAAVERTTSDERHLLLADAHDTQITLLGGTDLSEPLAFIIPADHDLAARVQALLAFWNRMTGAGPPEKEITPQRRRRLILGLRALDGRAAGASYRVLAAGLFGADRVPTGAAWKTHDLRSRTMRLVADATALMRGGYRGLVGL